jgi:predicted Zn-dependent protease with MMP-like domain
MSIQVDPKEFEEIAHEEFDALPAAFRNRLENVHIVVEETDSRSRKRRAGVYRSSMLLGLYEGVPLSRRGTGYGVYPVVPDRITLFQRNIEHTVSSQEELRERIREVMVHEIAHHFGMSEKEIRDAGY